MPKEPAKLSVRSKLRSKFKLLLNKLPTFAGAKRAFITTACVLISSSVLMLLAARAPEMHDMYIRYTVGSKVYTIKSELEGGGGTGFQVKAPSGTSYIATNSHVCDYIEKQDSIDTKQTVLVLSDDGTWVRRRIVAISDQTDLCLVEGMPGVEGLSLGSEPYLGERMTVVGHPSLRPTTLSSGEIIGTEDVKILDYIMSVTNPFIAMFLPPPNPDGKCNMPKNEMQVIPIPQQIGGGEIQVCFTNTTGAYMTSIVIYPGNSGSPMVDFYGRVTGVAFAASERDNYGDVVSLSDLRTFLAKY